VEKMEMAEEGEDRWERRWKGRREVGEVKLSGDFTTPLVLSFPFLSFPFLSFPFLSFLFSSLRFPFNSERLRLVNLIIAKDSPNAGIPLCLSPVIPSVNFSS